MDLQQHNRLQKLFIDQFYLLDIINNSCDFIFKIAGSTNNVYSVKIFKNYEQNKITCDCPDSKKWCKLYNVTCKHVLFVVFKVLKLFKITNILSRISVCKNGKEFLDNKTLNKDLVEVISVFVDLFNFNQTSENINQSMIAKYHQALKNIDSVNDSQNIAFNKEDTCCICFDNFDNVSKLDTTCDNKLIKCDQCVAIFHKDCLNKWIKFNNTCPYCRKPNFSNLLSDSKYIKLQ